MENKFAKNQEVKFVEKFEFFSYPMRLNSKCVIINIHKNVYMPNKYGYYSYWVEFKNSKHKTNLFENQLQDIK